MEKEVVLIPRRNRAVSKLKLMAEKQGTTPVEILRRVLAKHSTLDGAAAELGVSTQTLHKWRKRHGVVLQEVDPDDL